MNDLKNDVDSLVGTTGLLDAGNRRTFIKTALGTGFAAAVLPVCAQTMIKTDTVGLTAGEVSVTVNGQKVPAYRAQPEGKTNLPVILVISEIFGVHEHIADIARRFAKLGYLAIAPDFFVRQGNPAAYPTIAELNKEIISKVPDEQVFGDLDAYVAWAGQNGGNPDKIGINGFCWGGRIVWLYAATGKVKAGVAWYGRLVGQPSEATPKHPVDVAAQIKAPVLGLYGGKDQGIPLDTIDKMKSILATGSDAAKASQFVVYPEAGHAFHADYRPSYLKEAAEDGWRRTQAWFKANGVA